MRTMKSVIDQEVVRNPEKVKEIVRNIAEVWAEKELYHGRTPKLEDFYVEHKEWTHPDLSNSIENVLEGMTELWIKATSNSPAS